MKYTIIELHNLNEDLINQLDKNDNVFCTSTKLIKELEFVETSLKNRNQMIRKVLTFLRYVDSLLRKVDGTIINVDRDTFIEFFNSRQYTDFVSILKHLKVITNIPYDDGTFYVKGKLNKRFRVHSNYLMDDLCLVIFEKDVDLQLNIDGDFNDKLVNTIINLDIDLISAVKGEIESTKDNNKLRKRLNKVFELGKKRYIKKGFKVDRIYHSISNLSRVSREYLSFRGRKFHNIDVRCCQPLLLCYYLKKNSMPVDIDYILDCEGGIFYERFYEKKENSTALEISTARIEAKKSVYKNIFFGFNKRSLFNKKFKELYPNTWESMSIVGDVLASELQNAEANIFNKIIPKKSKGYYTLFDAIYFTEKFDALQIREDLINEFGKYELKPYPVMDDDADLDWEDFTETYINK